MLTLVGVCGVFFVTFCVVMFGDAYTFLQSLYWMVQYGSGLGAGCVWVCENLVLPMCLIKGLWFCIATKPY